MPVWVIVAMDAWTTPVGLAAGHIFRQVNRAGAVTGDVAFRGIGAEELLACVPSDYNHSFLFDVDNTAIRHPEFPVLVIDLRGADRRNFRAIPTAIQAIENNLSISNMDFSEFAGAVDEDGIFRGFPAHYTTRFVICLHNAPGSRSMSPGPIPAPTSMSPRLNRRHIVSIK
jgi:hypothetical protein